MHNSTHAFPFSLQPAPPTCLYPAVATLGAGGRLCEWRTNEENNFTLGLLRSGLSKDIRMPASTFPHFLLLCNKRKRYAGLNWKLI